MIFTQVKTSLTKHVLVVWIGYKSCLELLLMLGDIDLTEKNSNEINLLDSQ